ncbi:MAG: hypothetical protein M3142_16345 [Bacteroidota bacterium]|nr:hypothetical protein [Bacteroidota bacterium]
MDLQPGSQVLDVEAGTGSLTLLLPQVHFLGVDLTSEMVTQAQGVDKLHSPCNWLTSAQGCFSFYYNAFGF